MTIFLASVRLQLERLRRSPGSLQALVATPLYSLVFLSIVDLAGRPDLMAYAVLAPGVMALWSIGLTVSGETVDEERANGSLELLVAAPVSLTVVVLGRVGTITALSLVSVAESWLVCWAVTGVLLPVADPALFAGVLLCTVAAMVGTATALAGLFVLARSARVLQNALSYPVFLLGGAMVPTALLPDWLRPVSRLVFLSWSTDLLRQSLGGPRVVATGTGIAMILLLGGGGFAVGVVLMRRVLTRVRATGAVTLS
ncbi:ABC transporter permease [Saccharothrix violaceirubra]|uniref:ABC-2 type transport system permease protein n=1 Tax=Saccharothrix violaceirubra TaxID=413306 RepID=A0A7W7T3C3_9PSEU|nr:ABC transporter permease [Saccharothrix violaceirubra]MBB4965751.1 ABC-2 type transport system permease protein [Saccharothrix violaceirubra]